MNLSTTFVPDLDLFNISDIADNDTSSTTSIPHAIQIRNYLQKYYSVVLLTFGTVGNLLCFAVLSRKTFRASTIGTYLRFLTMCDLTALYTGVVYFAARSLWSYDIRAASSLSCKFHRWLSYVGCDLSSWALVLVSSARLISIAWPMKRYITPKRAYISITTAVVLICVINLPMFIMVDAPLKNGKRRCAFTSQEYSDFNEYIWNWIVLFKFQFIPASILIVLSTALVLLVSRSYKAVDQIQSHGAEPPSVNENFSCSETDMRNNGHVNNVADGGKARKTKSNRCCACSLARKALNKTCGCLCLVRKSKRPENEDRRHSGESMASGDHNEQWFCDMKTLVPLGNGNYEEHYTRNGRGSSPDRNSKHWKKYYNTGNMNNVNARRATGKRNRDGQNKVSGNANGLHKTSDDTSMGANTDDSRPESLRYQVPTVLTESKTAEPHSNVSSSLYTSSSKTTDKINNSKNDLNAKSDNIPATNPKKDNSVFTISSGATRSISNGSSFKNEALKAGLKKPNSAGINNCRDDDVNEIDGSTYGYVYLGTLPSDKSTASSNISETVGTDTSLTNSDALFTQNPTYGLSHTTVQNIPVSDNENSNKNSQTERNESDMVDENSNVDDDIFEENVDEKTINCDRTGAVGHSNIGYDSTDETNKETNNLSLTNSDNNTTSKERKPKATDNNFDEENAKNSDDDNTNATIPDSSYQISSSSVKIPNNTNRHGHDGVSTSSITTDTTSPTCTTQCITTHNSSQATKLSGTASKRRRSSSAQVLNSKGHFKSRSLTRSLIVINTVFLVCNIPIVVYLTGKTYFFPSDEFNPNQSLVSLIVNLTMYTNNAVNFILYCITGTRFRQQLKLMFQELFQKVNGLFRRR